MLRVLVNESENLQCMIIKRQIHQYSPSWMQNQTFKNEIVFENSALQKGFVGIHFYMFTKNLKTRLKRTRKICLSLTKF